VDSTLIRLTALERADRRARRIVRACALAAGFVLLSGQASPSSSSNDALVVGTLGARNVRIAANGFSVSDGRGTERIYFGLNATGSPVVQSSDPIGTRRQIFGVFSDGDPYLRFFDAKAKRRFDVSFTEGGHPSIEIDDASGVDRLDYFEATNGYAAAVLRGTDGKSRLYFENGPTGTYLGSRDGSVVRAYAGVFTDATSGMQFYNSAGTVIWKRP
jgi:hypothetical protein